jgi:hypothetical protein
MGLENFSSLDAPEVNLAVGEGKNDKTSDANARRKQKMREMNELFKDSLMKDPTFSQKLRTLSESVAVVNTLGFGDSGNIIKDEASTQENRKLSTTSAIVGYRIRNIGQEPIPYVTEEYAMKDNVWVGQLVNKVMQPGETVDLNRKYMTMFCARPEISFQLSNGKVMRGSAKVKTGDVDGELEAHYFTFNDRTLKVNSDEVKINVGRKDNKTKKWVVKKDFEAAFGYLNNEKVKGEGRTSSGERYTVQDMAANYIARLLEESGNM